MPNLNDAFDWAFRRVMSACEDRRLDPPAVDEPKMIDCRECSGHGFVLSQECGRCDGSGQIPDDTM